MSGRYAEDSKERVRAAADLLQVVGARVDLSKRGGNSWWGRCPFHDERTPSFHVRPAEGHYHCFGCQQSGDVFRFVMETEGLQFIEAMETLADRFGVELEREEEDPEAERRRKRQDRLLAVLERAAAWYARLLWEAPEAAPAREYLLGRGLAEETLRAFRVGWSPPEWDRLLSASRRSDHTDDELLAAGLAQRAKGSGRLFDRFRERIMFPLADERGRVRGFGARATGDAQPKYLNSSEGEAFSKGRQLFGLDVARRAAAVAGEVVLAEGYTDVLALHQAGVPNAVGLMGTALTEEQVALLARSAPRVLLALDADSAGQEAMLKAAALAARRKLELRVVALAPGGDPADLLEAEGAEALRARVGRSVPFVSFRVERILARADLGSAEGKDRALADLRPILAELGPSVLRAELVQRISSGLDLPRSVESDLNGIGPPRRSALRPVVQAPPEVEQSAVGRQEKIERSFLELCLASPIDGLRALDRLDLDRHFTYDATRRAARWILDHPTDPLSALDGSEPEVGGLLAALAVRAESAPRDQRSLEHAALLLERARLERAMSAARGHPSLLALRAEQDRVKQRIDELTSSA